MTDQRNAISPNETSTIMHALGQLTGEVRTMHDANGKRFDDLKQDIQRLEKSINERISRVENSFTQQLRDQGEQIGKRIDSIGNRVTSLENEDKRLIEKVSRVSAIGGSISGGLIAGAIELMKHVGK